MGVVVIVTVVAVHAFVAGPVIERMASADLDSADAISEAVSGFETARPWAMPFYVLGVLFMIVGIVKWVKKLLVEAMTAAQNRNT